MNVCCGSYSSSHRREELNWIIFDVSYKAKFITLWFVHINLVVAQLVKA